MMKKVLILGLALLLPAAMASAATVTAPTVSVAPGAITVVAIQATDIAGAQGIDMAVQLGDGGVAIGGTLTAPPAPAIGVDLLTNTVWSANNTGQNSQGETDLVAAVSTTTASGTIADASGVVAWLLVDATAATEGTWPLILEIPAFGFSTNILPLETLLVPGSIEVVIPEPAAALLLGIGGLFLRRRR